MRKTKWMKMLALTLVLVLGVISFTGCGDNGDKTPAAGSVNLVYWSMWNEAEPQGQTIKAAIDDFMVQNEGVKVTINWSGRDIRKTLQPALDGGEQIDIWDEDLDRVITTWSDYAMDLTKYIKEDYPSTGGKAYETTVMPSLMALGQDIAANKGLEGTWAIPYQPFVFAFMYNKDLFKEAGIETPPATWAEFMMACEKIKAIGKIPMTCDDAYIDVLPGYYLARTKGSDWVKELVNDPTKALWNDPAVLQMATAYYDMNQTGYISKKLEGNKWPAGQQEIADKTVAMYLNGTWLPNEIMTSAGEDFPWGTFSFPTIDGGVTGVEAANYGGQAFQISNKCANPDVAFALLAHITTGEWDNELAAKSFGVPIGIDGTWPKQLTDAKQIFDGLTTFYPWAGGIQANADMQPVVVSNFTKLISGKLNPAEFIAAMQK